MKRIIAILLFSLASSAYALPNCPSDQNQRYDNCFGTYIFGQNSDWAGDKYVGEWKDDKYHGYGIYTYTKGDKYVGEYKDDNPNGQGTYTWNTAPNKGDKYVGEYKDGKYHGQGTYTFAEGRKDSGYYLNDKYVPDICEGMGLSKGTSEFGQCVLKLIDKI